MVTVVIGKSQSGKSGYEPGSGAGSAEAARSQAGVPGTYGGGSTQTSSKAKTTSPATPTTTTTKELKSGYKYYITPSGSLTYRPETTKAPIGSREITAEAYQSIKGYVKRGGKVSDVTQVGIVGNKATYQAPATAKVSPQGFSNLQTQLKKSKTAGEFLTALKSSQIKIDPTKPYLTSQSVSKPLQLYKGKQNIKPSLEAAGSYALESVRSTQKPKGITQIKKQESPLPSVFTEFREQQPKRMEIASKVSERILTPQYSRYIKEEKTKSPELFSFESSFKQLKSLASLPIPTKEGTKQFSFFDASVSPFKSDKELLKEQSKELKKSIKTYPLIKEEKFKESKLGKLSLKLKKEGSKTLEESRIPKRRTGALGKVAAGAALGTVQFAAQEPIKTGVALAGFELLPTKIAAGAGLGLVSYSFGSKIKSGESAPVAVAGTVGEAAPFIIGSGAIRGARLLKQRTTKVPVEISKVKGIQYTVAEFTEGGKPRQFTTFTPALESYVKQTQVKNIPKVGEQFLFKLQTKKTAKSDSILDERLFTEQVGVLSRKGKKLSLDVYGEPKIDIPKQPQTIAGDFSLRVPETPKPQKTKVKKTVGVKAYERLKFQEYLKPLRDDIVYTESGKPVRGLKEPWDFNVYKKSKLMLKEGELLDIRGFKKDNKLLKEGITGVIYGKDLPTSEIVYLKDFKTRFGYIYGVKSKITPKSVLKHELIHRIRPELTEFEVQTLTQKSKGLPKEKDNAKLYPFIEPIYTPVKESTRQLTRFLSVDKPLTKGYKPQFIEPIEGDKIKDIKVDVFTTKDVTGKPLLKKDISKDVKLKIFPETRGRKKQLTTKLKELPLFATDPISASLIGVEKILPKSKGKLKTTSNIYRAKPLVKLLKPEVRISTRPQTRITSKPLTKSKPKDIFDIKVENRIKQKQPVITSQAFKVLQKPKVKQDVYTIQSSIIRTKQKVMPITKLKTTDPYKYEFFKPKPPIKPKPPKPFKKIEAIKLKKKKEDKKKRKLLTPVYKPSVYGLDIYKKTGLTTQQTKGIVGVGVRLPTKQQAKRLSNPSIIF